MYVDKIIEQFKQDLLGVEKSSSRKGASRGNFVYCLVQFCYRLICAKILHTASHQMEKHPWVSFFKRHPGRKLIRRNQSQKCVAYKPIYCESETCQEVLFDKEAENRSHRNLKIHYAHLCQSKEIENDNDSRKSCHTFMNWYFVSKIVLTFYDKNSDREKF